MSWFYMICASFSSPWFLYVHTCTWPSTGQCMAVRLTLTFFHHCHCHLLQSAVQVIPRHEKVSYALLGFLSWFLCHFYRPLVTTEMYKNATSHQVFTLAAASSLHSSRAGSPWSPFLSQVCSYTHTLALRPFPSMCACIICMGLQYCVHPWLPERKSIHFPSWCLYKILYSQ